MIWTNDKYQNIYPENRYLVDYFARLYVGSIFINTLDSLLRSMHVPISNLIISHWRSTSSVFGG